MRTLRLRFGLRTLLVAVAVASVLLAVFARTMYRVHVRRVAVRGISQAGGTVLFKLPDLETGRQQDPDGPAWLTRLLGPEAFNHVESVAIAGSQFNDDGLTILSRLQHLTAISLTNTNVTDAGIAQLLDLGQLEHLHLRGNNLTDQSIVHLKELDTLKYLDVSDTAVTDAGLTHLPTTLTNLGARRHRGNRLRS